MYISSNSRSLLSFYPDSLIEKKKGGGGNNMKDGHRSGYE